MASPATQNPPSTGDKSGKKKKINKVVDRTASPAPAATATPDKASSVAGEGAQDDGAENSYIRDLQRSLRALNKRLINANKTAAVVKEHTGKTLDELVSAKIINADQKTQYSKKPELEAQIADLDNQVAQHKKMQESFQRRLDEQEKALTEKMEANKATYEAEWETKAAERADKKVRDSLLVVSQFLRLAAGRRCEDVDPEADENLALEGTLLSVYSGDETAVATMMKLVNGTEDPAQNTAGEKLQTTFAHIKSISIAYSAALFPETAVESETTEAQPEIQTDPTVAHAGLTELEDGPVAALTNGQSEDTSATGVPANAVVADDAANAAAESQWDNNNTNNTNDLAESQEWVEVKPADVETPSTAAPASANPSWADDHPETPTETATPPTTDANDGFHQVQRNNRGPRDGAPRGRGRGGYRGRGDFRGDGRGRGRGGQRGSYAHRGPRRGGDES